jgi:hypothetical protein
MRRFARASQDSGRTLLRRPCSGAEHGRWSAAESVSGQVPLDGRPTRASAELPVDGAGLEGVVEVTGHARRPPQVREVAAGGVLEPGTT